MFADVNMAKKAVTIPYDSFLDTFTSDSLADRCLDRLWLQTDVCFPPGKTGGVGILRESLPLADGAGGAAPSQVTRAFPPPGPGLWQSRV